MRTLFVLETFDAIYGGAVYKKICEAADVYHPPLRTADLADNKKLLASCEILFSGWGAPVLDADFLRKAPKLRAVFYGAGSVRGLVTDAFWDAGLPLCSAWQANAVPVSETAYALIVLYLKRLPWFSARFRGDRAKPPMPPGGVPGLYEGVVGLVSLGAIGARVAGRLKAAKIKTLAFDPFLTVEKAKLLNVESVSLLELFERSDVVSLHTPLLEETQGMIGSRYLAAMKPGAALINTARGALIREEEFVEVFRKREDLSAFLDVTYPEPPAQDSPLWSLPNVTLAPHVAGSMGNEARRHGQMMLEEYMRFLDGQPLLYRVTRDQAKTMA